MTVRSVLEKRCPLGGTGYIIRKDVLKEVGLFDNHLVDDFELTFRLLWANHKIAFAPMSVDYDEKPPTLDIMFRQRARWSRGFLSLLKKRVPESNASSGRCELGYGLLQVLPVNYASYSPNMLQCTTYSTSIILTLTPIFP